MGRVLTSFLEIDGVVKSFGTAAALTGIHLAIERGTTMALLGPSGSGKSTLLRVVAGLEDPDLGEVRLEGRSLAGVPVSARGFGLMFQDLVLFPHLNVADNISFGLRMHRWPEDAARERVRELGELVQIDRLLDRGVDELSGGEQQRVALARSLAPKPSLLMLDEPLGSLDRTLRDDLIEEVRQILCKESVTALYVTHDQEEAFAIADRVAVMNDGRIAQEGRPGEVYFAPASSFVGKFLGHRNLFSATMTSAGNGALAVESVLGRWTMIAPANWPDLDSGTAKHGTLLIPIDGVSIRAEPASEPGLGGVIEDSSMRSGRYVVAVRSTDSGVVLTGMVPVVELGWNPKLGDRVWAVLETSAVRFLPWTDS